MTRRYSYGDEPIMTVYEQKKIIKWVRENIHTFNIKTPNRCRQMFNLYNGQIPKVFDKIKQRIIKREHLEDVEEGTKTGDSVGCLLHGGSMIKHIHLKENTNGKSSIFFNVAVQVPFFGGKPIYGETICNLQERRYICCRSGIDYHQVGEVYGDRERITISYAFLFTKNEIGTVIYDYGSNDSSISLFSVE